MRPKRIAVYCSDPDEMRLYAFVLESRLPVRAIRCPDAAQVKQAIKVSAPKRPLCAILFVLHNSRCLAFTQALIREVSKDHPRIPLVVVDCPERMDAASISARHLLRGLVPMIDVVDAMRESISADKRGPLPTPMAMEAESSPEIRIPVKHARQIRSIELTQYHLDAILKKYARGVPRQIIADLLDVDVSAVNAVILDAQWRKVA